MGTFWDFGNLEEPWGALGALREPWEPLLGNLGTFTWEPVLGTCTWNLGTLGESVLELLRSAPKPLLWLKTPKHSAVGEKFSSIVWWNNMNKIFSVVNNTAVNNTLVNCGFV